MSPLAHALLTDPWSRPAGASDEEVAQAVVEIATLHEVDEAADRDELDRVVVGRCAGRIRGVDRALVVWLGSDPSERRVALVRAALWHLWSPVNPHGPVDPEAVFAFVRAVATATLSPAERERVATILPFAAGQVNDPALLALLDEARSRQR